MRVGDTVIAFRSAAQYPEGSTAAAGDVPTVEQLSDTQRRVLVALCRPYKHSGRFATPATNQQIADEVFLSVDAVKAHLRSLFQRFTLDGLPQNQKRAKLAESALQWGVISERDL